jgi:hypothetical protein
MMDSAFWQTAHCWGPSPRAPTRQLCDHDQRGQGCAAPARLDLDHGARRGRIDGQAPDMQNENGAVSAGFAWSNESFQASDLQGGECVG